MRKKHNTLWLAFVLFRLWLNGWRQVPGYTVAEMEKDGDFYLAVQLSPPPRAPRANTSAA
jgi:hypothetical protein